METWVRQFLIPFHKRWGQRLFIFTLEYAKANESLSMRHPIVILQRKASGLEKYFNSNLDADFNEKSAWNDVLKIYDRAKHYHEPQDNIELIIDLVSKIDPEDRQFKEYINTRLQRINLLKDLPTRLTI